MIDDLRDRLVDIASHGASADPKIEALRRELDEADHVSFVMKLAYLEPFMDTLDEMDARC